MTLSKRKPEQKLNNRYISGDCGFVMQYVYTPDFTTYLRVLADSFGFCSRSTKCPVPFVKKTVAGFVFGDTPSQIDIETEPTGEMSHVIVGLNEPKKTGGGGMYNNAINQSRISKALRDLTDIDLSQGDVTIPCVMPDDDQVAFEEDHKMLGLRFEFINGKPREAHIVSVDSAAFQLFLESITDSKECYVGDDPVIKKKYETLQALGLCLEEIANLNYRNIHDKLPHLEFPSPRTIDLSSTCKHTESLIINNLPPGTQLTGLDRLRPDIEFRIGSNQLVELTNERKSGKPGPVSHLLASSSILFLNAEETHRVFGLDYSGQHGPEVTYALAKRICQEFDVPAVVITDEDRPVTALFKNEVVQVRIPELESSLSQTLYSILGQEAPQSRVQNPTGCGDTLAPAFQISRKIPTLCGLENQLRFAVFWSSVVYRISGSNLKDLPDATMRDLMAVCLEYSGAALAA